MAQYADILDITVHIKDGADRKIRYFSPRLARYFATKFAVKYVKFS